MPISFGPDATHLVLGRDGLELGHRLLAGVDHERAAVVEAAATRTGARRRGATWDTGQRARLAEVRDRVEQRPGVGVRGVLEHRVPRAQLDDLAGVHHRHPVGDVGDDGEVVGDVEGADPVDAAELGHRLEDHRLGGHVETGRRLVEHQHLGLGQERHGQRDALHLASRQLVGVAAEELVVAGQAHLLQTRRERPACATPRCRCCAAASARRSACRSGWPGSAPTPGPAARRRSPRRGSCAPPATPLPSTSRPSRSTLPEEMNAPARE